MSQSQSYIVTKRFKMLGMNHKQFNLPYGTICKVINNDTISYKNEPICKITSQNAYDYFCNNDDNKGKERGKLIKKIQDELRKSPVKWDILWDDKTLTKFRKSEHQDYWIWNFNFYNASIEDLKYIYNLIK